MDSIWHRKMCHVYIEKQKSRKQVNGKNYKIKKDQNARRKGNSWVLGNIESKHYQKWEDEKKLYLTRTRKLLKTKLCSRNLKWINTWAIPLVIYSGSLLKWTREKLENIDQRTRNLIHRYDESKRKSKERQITETWINANDQQNNTN